MLALISACTFGTVALLALGVMVKSEREVARERMRGQAQAAETAIDSVQTEMAAPFKARLVMPALRKMAEVFGRFTPAGAVQTVEAQLEAAGGFLGLGAKEFLGLRALSIIFFSVAGIAAVITLDVSLLIKAAIVLLAFSGAIMPDYLLQHAITNRQIAIRRMLPDTLDLLTVSVEAGLGLDGAMQKVIEKLKSPLSTEMERALQEMRIGKLRSESLRDMAKRLKIQELSSFVAAICQAEQLGVSIAQVLKVQSEALRQTRSQRAREMAAKLPVKMLFPLVFFIFPALFVVVLAPGAIQIGRALGIIK
jgi:tight adherence protein C